MWGATPVLLIKIIQSKKELPFQLCSYMLWNTATDEMEQQSWLGKTLGTLLKVYNNS